MLILCSAIPQTLYISFKIQCFRLSHLIRMENWCRRPGRWSFLCDTVMLVSAFGVDVMSLAKASHRCKLPHIFSFFENSQWNLLLLREPYKHEPVTKIYLTIFLSSSATLCSSDFHMKSSVFFTFSANWAARTLVLSRHSFSFSELRRSMLIKSTVSDGNIMDKLIKPNHSLRIYCDPCVQSVSQGLLTIEIRRIAVAWTWMPQRCEVGHHVFGRAAVHGWTRGQQHHQVKELEDVWAWLMHREQDQTVPSCQTRQGDNQVVSSKAVETWSRLIQDKNTLKQRSRDVDKSW